MAHEKIVTLFDTTQEAEAARKNLEAAGFHEHDISLITGDRLRSEGKAIRHPSIWQRLFGDTVDKEYAHVYTEALETGGVILTLRAHEDEIAKAMDILDSHQSGGYAGRSGDYTTGGAYGSTDGVLSDEPLTDTSRAGYVNTDSDRAIHTTDKDATREEVLKLAEERLEVGKRLVKEGATRVRRYVTSENVEAEVSLHEEHADIFRRAINEPAYLDSGVDWSDKVVEVTETREQPVINKTAQVVEEVVVRTDGTDRVEKVSDTVRRQQVDIDHVDHDHLDSSIDKDLLDQGLAGNDHLRSDSATDDKFKTTDPLLDPKKKF